MSDQEDEWGPGMDWTPPPTTGPCPSCGLLLEEHSAEGCGCIGLARIRSLESQLAEEREKTERLRGLLSWAFAIAEAERRYWSPEDMDNVFAARAALASTGSEEKGRPWRVEFMAE